MLCGLPNKQNQEKDMRTVKRETLRDICAVLVVKSCLVGKDGACMGAKRWLMRSGGYAGTYKLVLSH